MDQSISPLMASPLAVGPLRQKCQPEWTSPLVGPGWHFAVNGLVHRTARHEAHPRLHPLGEFCCERSGKQQYDSVISASATKRGASGLAAASFGTVLPAAATTNTGFPAAATTTIAGFPSAATNRHGAVLPAAAANGPITCATRSSAAGTGATFAAIMLDHREPIRRPRTAKQMRGVRTPFFGASSTCDGKAAECKKSAGSRARGANGRGIVGGVVEGI
ncbi:hypothetical protein niasHT_010995 [Heterodera trifolii]|uniref:Uncharacterized protein n=1 Tax=Heterodera trifolii TaxID=157864 RepID=A0ABD2LG66_9BILA